MSENIAKLMNLERLIIKFIDENPNVDDPEIDARFEETHYVERCINLLKRMNCKEVLEAFRRFEYIRIFVDFKVFLKKYPISKKEIKENPKNCLMEFDKLNSVCDLISDVSNNKVEFLEYIKILDVDNTLEYLLKNMPNEDLNILAQRSTDWNEKLYYYSYLKKD